MEPVAFSGTYSDFKPVKTRSVYQVIVEIPVERAEEFVKLFGIPQPGRERPVAIALLNARPGDTPDAGQQRDEPRKSRQPFHQMSRAQQAGILCADPTFQLWLSNAYPLIEAPDTPEAVRIICGVQSRSELSEDRVAGKKWDQLVTAFQQATGRMAEAR